MASEVATREQAKAIRRQAELDAWSAALEEADAVVTPDLVSGNAAKKALCGIPFLITRLEFRQGVKRLKGDLMLTKEREYNAYVTVTASIAPATAIRMEKVNMLRDQNDLDPLTDLSALPFDIGGEVVINDGSTGIYRQCVEYLEGKALITLGELGVRGKAGRGESVFDQAPYEWGSADGASSSQFSETGFLECDFRVSVAARKGLRPSDYQNDYNPDGSTTFYLA